VEEFRFAPDNSVVTVDIQGRVARWQGTDFQDMQPLLEIGSFDEACFSEDCRWLADAWVGRGIARERSSFSGVRPKASTRWRMEAARRQP
jgi:hypothetical protein